MPSLDVPYPSAYQEMSFQDQKSCLVEMLELLADKSIIMEMDTKGRKRNIFGPSSSRIKLEIRWISLSLKSRICQGFGKLYLLSVHIWGVDSLWKNTNTTNGNNNLQPQQTSDNVESEINTGITVVPFECCPGNCSESVPWRAPHGRQKVRSRLIYPDNHSVGGRLLFRVSSGKGWLVKVMNRMGVAHEIASDRHRVASFIGIEIQPPDNFTNYMEQVKWYGFDHVIIIGKPYCGILFLDCYGRIFEWDSMDLLL
ncbi:7961_t:CDS:2 [Paraglomus occultum]|uniref:7961_t:CDS:1 n=1 Tax=Paraglomus occultum TaxID=144539 RepID=A0A9N9A011_9GLOM|nr:7961_t:CDS:2 [Paraglomus occultum]